MKLMEKVAVRRKNKLLLLSKEKISIIYKFYSGNERASKHVCVILIYLNFSMENSESSENSKEAKKDFLLVFGMGSDNSMEHCCNLFGITFKLFLLIQRSETFQ